MSSFDLGLLAVFIGLDTAAIIIALYAINDTLKIIANNQVKQEH